MADLLRRCNSERYVGSETSLMNIPQAVYPAFFSLYVSRERRSSVQAMQLSNGLANPLGLWLGHLMFDSLFTVFTATVIIIIFSTVTSYFNGLGFLVCVFFLRSDRMEYQIPYPVVGHGPLWNHCHIVGVLCLFIHAFTSVFLRYCCGFPNHRVHGVCTLRWPLFHAHANTNRST